MQTISCFATVRKAFSCFAIALLVLVGQQSARSEEPSSNRNLDSIVAEELRTEAVAEMKIRKALLEPTRIEFIETPLIDVIEFLEEQHGIQIELVTSALDAIGIGSDTPITRNLKGISLKSALTLMLKDLELIYVIQDEILQITTYEESEVNAVTRVYDVEDLLGDDRSSEALVEAVTTSCFCGDAHVHASIAEFRGRLIVDASYRSQERVARLLAMFRATQGKADTRSVQNSLGLYPLGGGPAAQPLERNARLKEPKKIEIADPFGEGVPVPSKPKPKSKPAADPFGGGKADPFGGRGADPFGGDDADPFGRSGVDPFGGDSDPPGSGGN
jgi:hypothetical protein